MIIDSLYQKRKVDDNDSIEDYVSVKSDEKNASASPLLIGKCEDKEVLLPDPFPLPKHFFSNVELALSSQNMTKETNRAFLSAVASAMLVYKRCPTRQE